MRNVLLALLILLSPIPAHAMFLDCLFFDGFENPGTADNAALDALQVHNCARKTVIPAASPSIPMMAWSPTVAAKAQEWASGCSYAHGDHDGYGQNIFATSSSTPTMTDATLLWVGEQPDYNYATNGCASGKVCGHYTQIVWRSTTQVGCGQALCTANSPFGAGNWSFIVCDYSPQGNYTGQWPY